MNLALVFPGQGSQFVGMGQELYEEFPAARDTFEEANEVLGFDLADLCFQGDEVLLTDTVNAQPAILTTSVACSRALDDLGTTVGPSSHFVAGHSLGEYTALVLGGALAFSDGLRLVRERGRLMKEAGERQPGGMAAILGAEDEVVEAVCEAVDGVQVANYNSPGQVVISGQEEGLEKAMSLVRERGARRVIRLAVSIAAHSALMQPAAEAFAQAIDATPFEKPAVPLIANVTARPITEVNEIRGELVGQLTAPVRWVESIRYMMDGGVTTFVEVGPGDVLAGLIKRINRNVDVLSVDDPGSLREFIRELEGQ